MAAHAELVSQLRATLRLGLRRKEAQDVLHSLQDELLVPRGLYLNGGLSHFRDDSGLSAEILGLVVRADGSDLSELEVKRIHAWLAGNPAIAEFTMSGIKPADEFMPVGSERDEEE
jgi:hypothetical protein